MQILLCILILLAGLSPILTFARLFQMKEWRWDRLREHLRREGWFRQLFGIVRPIIIGAGILIFLLLKFFPENIAVWSWVALWGSLSLLGWFTLFRFVVGKQARPAWTAKAMMICCIALVLFLIPAWIFTLSQESSIMLILAAILPLVSFVWVFLAWLLLLPLDRFLKNRILKKARTIRKNLPNLAVIGITGSVGKTTTKELLAHILSDRSILITPVHVNTEMGVADLMRKKLTDAVQIFIVEMGAYCRGEIKLLCSLVRPHIGIITYIGKQHLGLFGSQEDLCRAKGELFEALPPEGHAFLNADVKFCEDLMKRASCPVHTVGTGGHATYEAFEIVEEAGGISFMVRGVRFSVPILGTHQVTNVLLAAAAAETLGVPLTESAKRLQTFKGPAQTFERKQGASGQIVLDDTYNASPESFRAAIEWARAHTAEKKLLLTSGLLELGSEEKDIHQELGLLSREVFDEVIFLSKKCVRYFEQGYGKTVHLYPKKKFALKIEKDMLIVCVGRMPETIVEKLLL